MTTTEHPAITRADIQAAWLKDNPQPDMRESSDVILAWARRWRQSKAYAECVELTERIIDRHDSQNHPNARHGHPCAI